MTAHTSHSLFLSLLELGIAWGDEISMKVLAKIIFKCEAVEGNMRSISDKQALHSDKLSRNLFSLDSFAVSQFSLQGAFRHDSLGAPKALCIARLQR